MDNCLFPLPMPCSTRWPCALGKNMPEFGANKKVWQRTLWNSALVSIFPLARQPLQTGKYVRHACTGPPIREMFTACLV